MQSRFPLLSDSKESMTSLPTSKVHDSISQEVCFFSFLFSLQNQLAFQKLKEVLILRISLWKQINAVEIGSGCNHGWKDSWRARTRSHWHVQPESAPGLVELEPSSLHFFDRNQLFVMSRRALIPLPAPASITFSWKESKVKVALFLGKL